MWLKTVIFFIAIVKISQSADILAVFPTPSVSHQIVFHALTKDLLSRGHNLTVLTPNPLRLNNANLTEIDLSSSYANFQKHFGYDLVKKHRHNIFGFVSTALEIFVEVMTDQMNCPDMKKFMNEKDRYKFDVMIMEHTGYYPFISFAEIFDVPVIGITSFEAANMAYQSFGSGGNIFANPEQNFPYIAHEATLIQRWEYISTNLLVMLDMLVHPFSVMAYGKFMKEYFPDIDKGIFELIEKVEFLMVNAHPAMGFVRPLVPNTIQLGFMHLEPPKPLDDGPLKKFLDNSKNGVIYISFGSNFKSKDLEPGFIDVFINVFKDLQYDVVWKFENDNLPNKPKNVFIQKWLPQVDLLAHPKIRLFITQCGQQSSEEAIDRGVPMVLTPFFADQPGLAAKLQSKGVGRILNIDHLNEKLLKDTIEEVLKPQYKENVLKLRELVHDQPMTSREKAVWWIEYFIRHKGVQHQDFPGRHLPFYKALGLDFIGIGIILAYIIVKALKMIVGVLRKCFKAKSD